MLVSLAILSVMMACEKGSGSGDEPELDLSPEEAMFLGYWINNASSSSKYYPNIYMSKDGRCYISGERGYEEGYWSYDSETKVLATSVGTWQFNVTLSNEDAWAGTYIYKDQVYNQSFKKASDFETFKLLAREIEPCKSALVVVSFEEDENKNDNVFNYSIESSSMVQTITGKVSMKNSTNLSKTEFTFTGCVEFTSKHSRILETDVYVKPRQISAVDLGLSVKWAEYNKTGVYAWGELRAMLHTNHHSYITCHSQGVEMCDISGSIRDIARLDYGGDWRLPTKSEWEELIEQCTWTWMGNGYEVKSKKNGNSIFLEADGYAYYYETRGDFERGIGGGINGINTLGRYWSTTPNSDDEFDGEAFALQFDDSEISFGESSRSLGFSIRPVCD